MKRKFSRAAWLIAPRCSPCRWSGSASLSPVTVGVARSGPPDTLRRGVGRGRRAGVQLPLGCRRRRGTRSSRYVGVAVYDAVMAVEGGYEPFAVDLDAPDGASSQAAVAAAARRILVHYLPAQAASIVEPAYRGIVGHHRRRPGRDRWRRHR